LVRLQPSSVTEIAARIRGTRSDAAGLVAALGLANHPTARRVLVDLVKDATQTREVRLAVVRALAQGEPDASTVSALDAAIDDRDAVLSEAAAYATGTAIAAWRKSDPVAAAPAVARLVTRMEQAHDNAARIVALRCLGNAADATALPVVRSALHDPDPAVRSNAVQALRATMAPGVDAAITDVMRHDASGVVRAAAIFSAGFRDLTTYGDALADAAVADREGIVRSAAVSALGRILDRTPRAREALAEVVKKDPDREIRKQARQFVDSAATGAESWATRVPAHR
jgi:hypothetical protein